MTFFCNLYFVFGILSLYLCIFVFFRTTIFEHFCIQILFWWWLWRFWWSDATRLLEVNRSEGEGDPDRASANKMEKRQKDKNTKRQKYKIQNTKCKYKIQIAKKKWKIYHLNKNRFFDFLRFSRKKWCLRRTAVTFERKIWH